MGCCASTSKRALPAPAADFRSSRARSPPPSFEEETVKEVLSETPIPKPLVLTKIEDDEIDKKTPNNVHQKPSPEEISNFGNRSFSGDLSARRNGSPARRSEQSPGRVRMVSDKQRRDAGGNGSRRSRSPATRTDGGERSGFGRSSSSRSLGKSPGRVRSELPERSRDVDETNREVKWAPTMNESLENPLVSLECFIFL